MERPDGLDDPRYAAFAWGRFRRILWGMAVVAVLAAGIAEYWLWATMGELHIVTAIATFLGVFFTIMMAAALMGLMFLSSGSGHDAQVEDPLKDEVELD
ncbi:hypothetical protein [Sphingomonas sp.]|uniref:hypothetical protein n=1 Tax=Sphingomonas sp. TaxID=28214 RepID=UPI002FD992EB